MKRRELFKLGSAAGLYALAPAPLAWAQGQPYREVNPPVATSAAGKVEVIEFFWYGCGHCFNFEPRIQKWKQTLADDVVFRQVPVGWDSRRVNFAGHQKLFYTLEVLGVLQSAHQKVFNAMHIQKLRLNSDEEIFEWAQSIGLDREKFANAFKSFSVVTKAAQAKKLTEAYKIDGVPSMAVGGKFVTSETLAGSARSNGKDGDVFGVVELLIMRERQAGMA